MAFSSRYWQSYHLHIMVSDHLCNTYTSSFFLSHYTDLKISNLIASEIIRNEDINARVSAIEKWVAVADICRCLHNYNAVLEITSSMNRSAIFRLKKTWLKVSKQVRPGAGAVACLGPGWGWGARVLAPDVHRWAEDRVGADSPGSPLPGEALLPHHLGAGTGTTNVVLGPRRLYFPLE